MENDRNSRTLPDVTTPRRLVVKVLQDVTAKQSFETYADLAEALKARCAKLKIPYHSGLVTEAIAQLEQGGKKPLIPIRRESHGREPMPEGEIIPAGVAARIVNALLKRFAPAPPKPAMQAPAGFPKLKRVR